MMLTPDQMTAIMDRLAQEKFGQLLQEIEAQTALLGADNELLQHRGIPDNAVSRREPRR